jgi:DNA-binding GntR family transcriptional regulator
VTSRAEGPLYARIHDVLREHIEGNRLPSGLVLRETSVARLFNTSRIPAATALRKLRDAGLIRDFQGRGYIVGDGEPLRLDLEDAGLEVAQSARKETALGLSNKLYPEVEHAVAAVLAHGRFLLNESALADHYGTSRAIAHEVVTRLERTGLIVQDSNQRWYAGPLTPQLVREHFEMRWLLEPVALRQAAPNLDPGELAAKRRHVEHLKNGHKHPELLERIEHELHVELIQRCDNAQLRYAVRRSQLPLIATHSTYRRTQTAEEIVTMASEHWKVFDSLLSGHVDDAANALESHLRRAAEHNVGMLERLPEMSDKDLPGYLARA